MAEIDDIIRTDYKAVDKHDTLSSVIGWVRGDTNKVPIITDGGRPFGVINERAIMSRAISHSAKVEPYTLTTRAMPRTASPAEMMARMAEYRTSHLPIEENGKLAGYVSAMDLARDGDWQATANELYVPVATLSENSTLGDALHLFNQEYVDHLPVLDANGKLAGVLKRADVLQMNFDRQDIQGRKDAGGNPINPLKDAVKGFMDSPRRVRWDAKKEEVLRKVEDFGYTLVEGSQGQLLGIVTPNTLPRSVPR